MVLVEALYSIIFDGPHMLEKVIVASSVTPILLWVALFASLIALVLRMYQKAFERPDGFPPGPPRLPIWGSYWFILWENYSFMHKAVWALAQRYKVKIMGFYLGEFPCVLLTDYEDIKEMQSRADFAGRPDVLVARERSFGGRNGVVFSDGPAWSELRRFLLRHMRDYGWGRRHPQGEAIMEEEVNDAVALLKGEWSDEEVVRDGLVNTAHFFTPFSLNVMLAMFSGERLPRGSHGPLREIVRSAHQFFRVTDPSAGAVSMTPWLRFLSPSRWGLNRIIHFNQPLRKFVRTAIDEHRKSLDGDQESTDFLDKYLKKMGELALGEEDEVFSERQLLLTGVDMLTASVGALGSAVAFLWQQLLHHPEVQANIQQEVDSVIGKHRQPTLDDRNSMVYTEATIRESMRRISLAPMSLAHVALEDTMLHGYKIPKGTVIYPHLHGIHMDPDVWGDPENFRPDRFIGEDGKLKKDITFPFGGGKRLCLGETFSRHIMFLMLASIMQHFTLLPSEHLPHIDHARHGFTLVPDIIWARIVPRS